MDLQVMKMFKTVAETGSFLAASHEIGYVQSGLSTRIQQLEDELGAQLFYRSSRGVLLTPKGELLLEQVNNILAMTERAVVSMRDEKNPSGRLRLGTLQTLSETSLSPVLARYHRKYPDVALSVVTGTSGALTESVLDRSIDAAFVAGNIISPDLKAQPFVKENICIAYSAGEKEISSFRDIDGQTLLVFPLGCSYRHLLETILRNEKIAAAHTIEFSSVGAIIAAASAGMGISLLPESVLHQYEKAKALKLYQVPAKYASVQTHFIYRRDYVQPLSFQTFIRLVQNEF